MATYCYICPKCQTVLDLHFEINDIPKTVECPHCRVDAKRAYLPPFNIFKGPGFTKSLEG